MYFVEQLRKTYADLGGCYTLKQPKYDEWAMKATTLMTVRENVKSLSPDQIVEHVRSSALVTSVHHSHVINKPSNGQQSSLSPPVKRLKTVAFDNAEQPYIITSSNNSDLKPTLLITTQQPRAMTVR